jgi:hypothetical protein
MSGALGAAAAAGVGVAAGYLAGQDLVDLYRNTTAGARTNQNITFPDDLISANEERNAYCALRFSRYVRRSIKSPPVLDVASGINLPLPANLRESQSVEYSTESLGPMIGAAADATASAISTGGAGGIGGIASSIASNIAIGGAAEAYQRLVPRIPMFGNQIAGAISSLSGITVNPFQTILFKAPNFKKHSFSWKFIPRTPQESEKIRVIVELFKYHSSPGITTGVFFSYPEILEIALYPRNEYLYKFKPCVVDNVTVNYAPNGPSIYRSTGAPTAVEVTLSIQELEYWTKNDYNPSLLP